MMAVGENSLARSGTPSYDQLYEKPAYDAWFPKFEQRQRESARQLSEILFPTGRNVPFRVCVEHVIDVGCGDGSLLEHLAKALPAGKKNLVGFWGLDLSAAGIRKARKRGIERADFLAVESEDHLFETLSALLKDRAGCTAVLFMGHTWFHVLKQRCLLELLRKQRPALVVVDIDAGWDDDIEAVSNGRNPVDRPFEIADGYAHSFHTVLAPGGDTVHRGIARTGLHAPSFDWEVRTEQARRPSSYLFGPATSPLASLSEVESGALLGQCDYILIARQWHPSGWGPMHAHVLVPIDPHAAILNDQWAHVLRDFARSLFGNQTHATPLLSAALGTGVRDQLADIYRLLDFFDEENSQHRALAIILPFDPIVTFARMSGLPPTPNDDEIFTYDNILELPNRHQQRFPTAYGIYHTMLDIVSSSQAFALDWAPNAQKTAIDVKYELLEKDLLQLEDLKDPDFSIVPVYYASLPLFCLVMRFPEKFASTATSAEVHRAILKNLHDQVKLAVFERFRIQVLRPFINNALDALARRDETEPDLSADWASRHLALIEDYVFGARTRDGRDADESRTGGALDKPWKSWILAIPSQEIKALELVKAERRHLRDLWRAEADLVLANHEIRISYWFQEAKFFADEKHECWLCERHLDGLRAMFALAGYEGVADAAACDAEWLADAIAWFRHSRAGYFAGLRDHFLFEWLATQLEELRTLSGSCDKSAAALDREQCSRNAAFLRLKSVFCKLGENEGLGIRFGLRRLHCLLTAATGRAPEMMQGAELNETVDDLSDAELESSNVFPNDPSMALADFAHELMQFRKDEVRVAIGVSGERSPFTFTVTMMIEVPLEPKRGGKEHRRVEQAFSRLKALDITPSTDVLYGSGRFTFAFVLRRERADVAIVAL